jgi:hypothetical protein
MDWLILSFNSWNRKKLIEQLLEKLIVFYCISLKRILKKQLILNIFMILLQDGIFLARVYIIFYVVGILKKATVNFLLLLLVISEPICLLLFN